MANLARIRTIFTGVAGTPWYSNFYFEIGTIGGIDYIQPVDDFWTTIAPQITNLVDWEVQAEVVTIDDATGDIIFAEAGTAQTGGGTAVVEPLPYSNQAVLLWNTGEFVGGRQIRGKTFIPGLTQGANDNGSVITATRTVIQAAATELISDGNGSMRVYSPTNATSAVIQSSNVSTVWGSLRSRRD